MIFHYFAREMFFFIDKIDNNGWYSIPEWTPFRADYIKLWGKTGRHQAQLFNGGWEWLDLTRIFVLQLSVTPGVGHNLYAALYATVISRRVPPFVRSWLIVSTEYFQDENIIVSIKTDTI